MGRNKTRVELRTSVIPNRFVGFVVFVVAAAAVSMMAAWLWSGWHVGAAARLWLLGLLVLAGELLPIAVPRRGGLDKVTISTAFAFAVLLCCGMLPACAVAALAVVIADLSIRTAPLKVLFNAAQYELSLAGAGAVLALTATGHPVALHAGNIPAIALAAIACVAINHALAGTAVALLTHRPVTTSLLDDLAFHALTAGCLLTLAPAVVASTDATLALVPIAFVPVLAVYFWGRQAQTNAYHAVHDRLTDLPNRWLLIVRLADALKQAQHTHTPVAVMIIDLDDFKSINDTLGHEYGDRVLQQIAPRLARALGPNALLARLGGDEFAALIDPIDDHADALRHAHQALAALATPCQIDTLALHTAASIGVACYPDHGTDTDTLIRHADIALYDAKQQRATAALYTPQHNQHTVDRLTLAAELRHAIPHNQLIVHYQPKIPLSNRHTPAVEALVRWQHPELGRLSPDDFIPLAEQTGLIKPLTEQVLESALCQCQAWRHQGLDARFSVNISTRTLVDQDLPTTIQTLLERYHIPPTHLQLEITESRTISDVQRAQSVLHQLHAIGVTIAIDDFGTGYSSLSQLQQLPVDEIKIDRSFVTRMQANHDDAILVRSIIDLARNLGLHVTAEGVETAATHQTLTQLGCDYAQGYFYARPLPADECRKLLETIQYHPPSNPPEPLWRGRPSGRRSCARDPLGTRGPIRLLEHEPAVAPAQ